MRTVIYKVPEDISAEIIPEIKLSDLFKIMFDSPISDEEMFQVVEQIADMDIAVDFFSSNQKKYVLAEEVVFPKLSRMLNKRIKEPSAIVSLNVLKELYHMEDIGVPINAETLRYEANQVSKVCTESIIDLIAKAEKNQLTVTETDIRGSTFLFPAEFIELNTYLQVVRKNIKHANMLNLEKLSKYIFQDNCGKSRLRAQWDIFGALSGRIQSYNFNVQGLPKTIRQSCIQPSEGYSLICADYVSEELLLMAVLSSDEDMIDLVMKQEDLHKMIASYIFEKEVDQVTKEERSLAKKVDFPYLYGAGDTALKKIIMENWSGVELSVTKVKSSIKKVFSKVENIVNAAEKKGYIELIDKTQIPLVDIQKKHTYFNRMVQGSGAIILKKVVSDIAKQLPDEAHICFLLHDELMVETPSNLTQSCVDIVTKTMTKVLKGYGYDIDIPISVEIKEGGVKCYDISGNDGAC